MKGAYFMLYNITNETLALIPSGRKTKIIEVNKTYNHTDSIINILTRNCIQNGSSLDGRQKSSAYLIGSSYKTPIIISEIHSLIFIPTHSIRNENCMWLNLKGILSYDAYAKKSVLVEFINHQKMTINISYEVFDKQVLRATRLEIALRAQKEKKYL